MAQLGPVFLSTAAALVLFLAALAAHWVWARTRPLRITAVYIYPVKSCRGIRLQASDFNRLGLKYDRQWCVVDARTTVPLTAREQPRMVLIAPRIDEVAGTLTLSYPNVSDLVLQIAPPTTPQKVVIWDQEVSGRRYDEEATNWLTSILADPSTSASTSTSTAEEDTAGDGGERAKKQPPVYHLVSIISTKMHRRPLSAKHDWNKSESGGSGGGSGARLETAWSDGYPLLLATDASLRQVNAWTRPTRDVSMRAFRPNIVVDGGNLRAWAEDKWRCIQVGPDVANQFWVSKPCERCIMTTVVPETGERHPSGEPLISLRQHRKMLAHIPHFATTVFFGQNLIHRVDRGRIAVGDRVTIVDCKPSEFEFAPGYCEKMKPNSKEAKARIEEYGF